MSMSIPETMDGHSTKYNSLPENNSFVFQSEIVAIRGMLPESVERIGLTVGSDADLYDAALGLNGGIERFLQLPGNETDRGNEIREDEIDRPQYSDMQFDFILMILPVLSHENLFITMKEAYRILKADGSLLVGFMDRDHLNGRPHTSQENARSLYKQPTQPAAYKVEKIINELIKAGFRDLEFKQTLFGNPDRVISIQQPRNGYGKGSFVVIGASKKIRSKQSL